VNSLNFYAKLWLSTCMGAKMTPIALLSSFRQWYHQNKKWMTTICNCHWMIGYMKNFQIIKLQCTCMLNGDTCIYFRLFLLLGTPCYTLLWNVTYMYTAWVTFLSHFSFNFKNLTLLSRSKVPTKICRSIVNMRLPF